MVHRIEVSTTTRPRLVFTSTRIDFPGIPKELILLRIQFSSIKFIKSYKKPYSNRISMQNKKQWLVDAHKNSTIQFLSLLLNSKHAQEQYSTAPKFVTNHRARWLGRI